MASEEDETKPEAALDSVYAAQLIAIGDKYGELVERKSIRKITRAGIYQDASVLFTQSLYTEVVNGKYDLSMALSMAVAWGIYVAELGQTCLTDDTRVVN